MPQNDEQFRRVKQLSAEHQQWTDELIQWRKDCRDALDMLLTAQRWMLEQTDVISEHERKIHQHHLQLVHQRETEQDAKVHEQVREAHNELRKSFPKSIANFKEALRGLHLGMLD